MDIRQAQPADLPAMLEIYNEAVLNTTASWDYDPWTPVQHADWYANQTEAGFPLLVATQDDQILGYATYGEFGAKVGYATTKEHSIYLRPQSQGQGIGQELLRRLIGEARVNGVHTLIGLLSADNQASLRLHANLGFAEAGRLPQVGRKFGRWLDLVCVQLLL